jgi:RimJ/RimL family protein N-acetyltransferase
MRGADKGGRALTRAVPVRIPLDHRLRTRRILLRRFVEPDAARVCEIQSNWNVTRMLRLASFPPTLEAIRIWLLGHQGEWERGTAHRFALIFEDVLIGCADIDEIGNGRGELGYWLDEPYWGRGLASEAAEALLGFAFDALRLGHLWSGHAADNPASGRVLEKLGFRFVGETKKWSQPRQREIMHRGYQLAQALP